MTNLAYEEGGIMSETTQIGRQAPREERKGGEASAEAGASWIPAWLRGAGLEAQEKALKPGNQPGFDAQEAARRPDAAEGRKKGGGKEEGAADTPEKEAPARPPALKYITPHQQGRTTSIIVSPGLRRGVTKGEVVSWGHVEGVVEEVWEFRAMVRFPVGGPSVIRDLLSGYGGTLDFGKPRQAPPGEEKDDEATEAAPAASAATPKAAAAAKKPRVVVLPGSPKVRRSAGGHAGRPEISNVVLPFRFGPAGQKLERASVDYSGDFSQDDIVREALAALSQLAAYDLQLEALTEADLKPHAVRLARIIRSAK